MAMKVAKTSIYRLNVDMSCGCRMFSEFTDVQCKVPVLPLGVEIKEGTEPPLVEKVFKPCSKHAEDASLSMLEFILSERMDEAVESEQKTPVHLHSIPSQNIEEGDTGGVVATGENVQSVARINKPSAVGRERARPENVGTIKTLQRSHEQLAKSGAAPIHTASGAAEIQVDEVSEDTRATPHIAELLDVLDERESGLFGEE